MQRFLLSCVVLFSAAALAACSFVDDGSSPTNEPQDSATPYRTTGLALTADALAETDIQSMKFRVTRVNCNSGAPTGFSDEKIVDFEDMYLPGGIELFEDEPFDGESQHMFSDAYFLLDAGCYDVMTQPLRAQGLNSRMCRPAFKTAVRVRNGRTTEILLVNQCRGPRRGGLDVVGSINHPPEIDDLLFKDSKFISACQPLTQVCATASDPDNDPLEFVWRSTRFGSERGQIEAIGPPEFDPQTGQWTSCAEVVTTVKGDYGFVVRIFDLDGNGTRMRDLLRQQDGGEGQNSTDNLRFPMYAGVACGS